MTTILSRKWTVEIIEALFEQELHFSELERAYPEMSGKMLSRRVKELFDLGLIGKAISSVQPLEFKYRITYKGKQLQPLFYDLAVVTARLFREDVLEDPTMDTSEIETYFATRYHQDTSTGSK